MSKNENSRDKHDCIFERAIDVFHKKGTRSVPITFLKTHAVLYFLFISLMFIAGCSRLATIPHIPKITPEMWLKTHPHVVISLGSLEFILMEPTSTFLVYFLGVLGIIVGLYFLRIRGEHRSRLWWGIALVLWGIQAILGGTDYQALSYELKCSGKKFCSYISWVEIYYYLVSIVSINSMVVAVAWSSAEKN